jgi:signal transduction histidine kinase
MNENELKNIWQSSNEKVEMCLQISRENTEDITKIKIHNFLYSMRPIKAIAVVIGILWVIFVDTLIINLWDVASPFFLLSAIIQVVLTKLAIGVYLYQLYLIRKVDLSEPVLYSQERLSRLKSSTLWVTRILFLQLPAWTTFSMQIGWLSNGNILLLIIQGIISLSSVYIAVWLFLNIKYENRDKKWFRWLFNGKEWDPIVRSIELIEQIKDYRSEEPESTPAN